MAALLTSYAPQAGSNLLFGFLTLLIFFHFLLVCIHTVQSCLGRLHPRARPLLLLFSILLVLAKADDR